MLRSGDITDLKQYNAMMRQLLDQYVQAPKSEVLEKLNDFSFLDMIDTDKRYQTHDPIDDILDGEKQAGGQPAAAETITASVRSVIIRKRDANPDYYDKLSEKLNKLLEEMRQQTAEYKATLRKLIDLMRAAQGNKKTYPAEFDTDGKKALFDNLGEDADLAQRTYEVVKEYAEQGFRNSKPRQRAIRLALRSIEGFPQEKVDEILSIIINNPEF